MARPRESRIWHQKGRHSSCSNTRWRKGYRKYKEFLAFIRRNSRFYIIFFRKRIRDIPGHIGIAFIGKKKRQSFYEGKW